MTGVQFEKYFCDWLKRRGYWALNIPRSVGGAQPFDVVAIKKRFGKSQLVIVADCKVISGKSPRFPFERVEDNQWLAFKSIGRKTDALVLLVFYHNDQMYAVPYYKFSVWRERGEASITLTQADTIDKVFDSAESFWELKT